MLKIAIVGTGKMGSLLKETAQNQGYLHCARIPFLQRCTNLELDYVLSC